MTSPEDPRSATNDDVGGREEHARQGAEVIDLVQLPAGARPRPRVELCYDEVLDARALDCPCYAGCLSFAAKVHWKSFSCRQCPKLREPEGGQEEPGLIEPAAVIRLR